MEIIVNGESRDLTTEGINTFKELMDRIESDLVVYPNVVTRIFLNEEELDEGQEIGFGNSKLDDIASLALETANSLALTYQSLTDAQDYLPKLSEIFENSAKLIRGGNLQEGLYDASQALDVIAAFSQILDSIRTAFQMDFSKVTIDEINLLDKLNKLNRYANEVLEATKDENWTLFADLIEYELSPLLYEWMAVIPELVKLLPEPENLDPGKVEG